MFGHEVDHERTNKPEAGRSCLFFFCVFFREKWPIQRFEKYKSGHHFSLKKNEGRPSVCLRILSNTGLNFKWKTVKLSGASQKCHFLHFSVEITWHVRNRVLLRSLDRWWIGQWNLCPGLFTGRDLILGSGREGLKTLPVRSVRVRRCRNFAGRVGSSQYIFKSHRSGRVGWRSF